MEYTAHIRNEIYHIIEAVESGLRQYEFSKNLHITKTLSRCFLVSIFQMIRGTYAALDMRSLLVYQITCRSIIEHLIDLYFVALYNDSTLNRQFADYHRLLLYWGTKDIEFYVEEIPRVEREYRDYVLSEFPSIVNSFTCVNRGVAVPDWETIDKKLRNKYRNHWSGLSFYSRVTAIIVAWFGRDEQGVVVEDWREIHEKAKVASGKNWPKMSFKDRCVAIVQQLPAQSQDRLVGSLDEIDRFLLDAVLNYGQFSNYTHPTSYSSVPHHNPETGTFQLDYNYPDYQLRDAEHFLFLLLSASIDGFSLCLPSDQGNSWKEFFHNLVDSSPNLASWFWDNKNGHATRPRH